MAIYLRWSVKTGNGPRELSTLVKRCSGCRDGKELIIMGWGIILTVINE